MKRQEQFNRMVNHLRRMEGQSKNNRACLYRGPNGNRCAIGILIPNKSYDPKMDEGLACSITSLFDQFKSIRKIFQASQLEFLKEMQHVHDSSMNWKGKKFIGEKSLIKIANNYRLKYTPPKRV